MNFRTWLQMTGVSDATCAHYYGAVYGSRLRRLVQAAGLEDPVYCTGQKQLDDLIEAIQKLHGFIEINRKGNRMYRSALLKYRQYAKETEFGTLELDDGESPWELQEAGRKTERIVPIRVRLVQGKFRAAVMAEWEGRCAVTGLGVPAMLVASHIKPWCLASDAERLNPENGILLSSSFDRAFDQGLISFRENTGEVLISPFFREHDVAGIFEGQKLCMTPPGAMRGFLQFHQEKVFLKNPEP